MDCFRSTAACDVEDLVEVEIRLAGCRRTNVVRVVGLAHMQRFAVHVGEHGNRLDAHLATGADDVHRDFAAVGYENSLEHVNAFGASAAFATQAGPTSCDDLRVKASIVMHGFQSVGDVVTGRVIGWQGPAAARKENALLFAGRAFNRLNPVSYGYAYFAGVSVVTIPVGPAFSALAFLVAMVLSTQSSADFRSALRASGLSHSKSARSRYIKFR